MIDLETTGGGADDEITEVGAVLVRGGEELTTLATLVDPGCVVPPRVSLLTGITDAMVARAPSISAVLPALLEMIGDAVLVGHNLRFDLRFLDRALVRAGHPRLGQRRVDTLALARRLLADEVPDHRLATLADRLRLARRPSHRALDDALATADLLHALIERASAYGVLGLDDLLHAATIAGHPQAAKLPMTATLPHAPGVYLFRDRHDRVLYVGTAADLRARVRSYFSSDRRRKVSGLLRETARIEHRVLAGPLEREVTELRLIAEHQPRYNRQGRRRSPTWLKLTGDEAWPRLVRARVRRDDGALYLGPFRGARAVDRMIEAIQTVVPLRRCTERPRARPIRAAPCVAAQLGVATCPCAGGVDPDRYAGLVETVRRGLTGHSDLLLGPLRARIDRLALARRYEEAAATRDRAAALADALRRQRRIDGLRSSGRVELVAADADAGAVLVLGRPAWGWHGREPPPELLPAVPPPAEPLAEADELSCVARWLDRHGEGFRLRYVSGTWASPLPAVPSFRPGRPP